MSPLRRRVAVLLAAAALSGLAGCSTPESKVEGYTKRGQALLQKGDLPKARLEFQNALQINPSAVQALYGMALIAERNRDWVGVHNLLSKVLELDPRHLEALIKLGKLQLAGNDLDKALQLSEAAHKIDPQRADALGLRAAVFLKLNDGPTAVRLANQALQKEPRHVESLVVLASERMQANDPGAAITFLDRALEVNERNAALQILKVQALERLSRADQAEAVLRKLVALFPDNSEYHYLIASYYLTHGQPAKAEAEHRALVAAQPKAVNPKLELVRFLGENRGIGAAASELQKFSQAEPASHELKLTLAGVRMQQNDPAAAIALWKEVIAAYDAKPPGLQARAALATYHLARKDAASAKALVAEILERDVRNEQGLYLRARIAIDERRLDDAVADLRTILRDSPDSASSHLLLAGTHELQGLRDLAAQHYAQAAQASHFAPGYAMPYAEHLMRAGRTRQAEGVLRELLRATPEHLPALKLLAECHLKSGDLAAAQAVADQVARLQGGEGAASQIRGTVLLARKDFGSGIAALKRAYELAPAEPQAMVSLVRSYVLANKSGEALAFLQSVLAASPSNQTARLMQGQLLAYTGNLAGARAALESTIKLNPADPAPHQALVNVNLAARQADAALAAADRGLQAAPGDFGLRLARASVLEQQGRTDDAIAAYESLLAEQPNAIIAANNLASILADHRKDAASLRRAYELAQRFRNTDSPYFKDTVGWTMHLAGKPREAADLLQSAAAGAPELAVAHYHYGMNQLALNNAPAAKTALRRSIELAKTSPFPQVEEARRTLQGL